MAIQHVYNQTVADGTATSIVRPSDWNSAHKFTQTISGNTLGTSTQSGTNLVWAGGNNITLSANTAANVATISIIAPNSSSLVAGANITLSTTGSTISVIGGAGGAGVAQLNGSTGTMSLAVGSSLSASSNGSTITFGMASNITTALQSAGAYLTTAAQSGHSHNFATTTTNGAAIVVGTANSVGATIGVPSFLTTAAQSDHSHGNPTLALTNLSGTTASNSAGLTLSLSAGAGGANDGYNAAQFTNSTANSTQNVLWAGNSNGSGNITLGLTGSTVTGSAPSGSGGGAVLQMSGGNTAGTVNTYSSGTVALYAGNNITLSQSSNTISVNAPNSSSLVAGSGISLSTNGSTVSVIAAPATLSRWHQGYDKNVSSLTSHNATSLNGSFFIQHAMVPAYVTGTRIGQIIGFTAQTSHNSSNVLTISQSFGLYSRTAATATQLTLASSGSTTFAATWSSSTTTAAFGMRELYCPMNVLMTPGEWFIANVLSVSATNGGSAASFSRFGVPIQTAGGGAANGFGGNTNATDAVFFPAQGVWNATTAAMPSSLGLSAITQTGTALMYGNQYIEVCG